MALWEEERVGGVGSECLVFGVMLLFAGLAAGFWTASFGLEVVVRWEKRTGDGMGRAG